MDSESEFICYADLLKTPRRTVINMTSGVKKAVDADPPKRDIIRH